MAAPESGSAGVTRSRAWNLVLLLFIASLINYLDRATLSFAIKPIAKELNLDPAIKGVLLSAFFWSYALMQIPMGLLSDRWNLRWLYAGAFTVWSVAQGLTGFATTLGALIVFRMVLGVGEAIYLPGGTKVVSLLFKVHERGLPCGLFDFGTRSGLVLEGILVPWLLETLGWRQTFAILGFTALLWLIPWFALCPREFKTPASPPPPPKKAGAVESLLRQRGLRNLAGICLGFFCFDYYWYILLTWLPDYLMTVRQFSLPQAGLSVSCAFAVFGISEPLGGWLADQLVRKGWDHTRTRKGIVTAAFCCGLLMIPAVYARNNYTAVALIITASLVGLATANMLVIVQACAPPKETALWVGTMNFAGNLGGVVVPIITGYIIKKTGSYAPAFTLAAVVLVTGLIFYWFVVGELRTDSEERDVKRSA